MHIVKSNEHGLLTSEALFKVETSCDFIAIEHVFEAKISMSGFKHGIVTGKTAVQW